MTPKLLFPDLDNASRSVALSAVMTGLARHSLPAAPLHGFSGPPGSGKTELCELISLAISRRPPARLRIGDDPALFRALQDGAAVILFDEIRQPVNWPTLARVLTRPTWARGNQTVSTAALFLACGQDLEFQGELASMVVVARLGKRLEVV